MSEALSLSAAPDPEAVNVAMFALWAAVRGLPRDKALRRLWKMESAAHEARNEALGRANVYPLRGRGTADQMDAARRSRLDRANVLLAAIDLYRRRAWDNTPALPGCGPTLKGGKGLTRPPLSRAENADGIGADPKGTPSL